MRRAFHMQIVIFISGLKIICISLAIRVSDGFVD